MCRMSDATSTYLNPSARGAGRRGRFDATVVENRAICREHFLLRMRVHASAKFPATEPGQFIQLGCRTPNGAMDTDALLGRDIEWQPGERPTITQPEICNRLAMLRRPFSLAGRVDDAQGTTIDIIHRVVGVGTDWLSHLKPGDAVDFIGPLGNTFRLPADKRIGLLVGGGVGLPPMFYLSRALQKAGWQGFGFVGAMTADLLAVTWAKDVVATADGTPALCVREFADANVPAIITTNDGSRGLKGLITAGVERVLQQMSDADRRAAVLFTCGPEPMMHAAAKLAAKYSVDCQVCLEQAMACGMATCQSCVVKIDPTLFHPERHEPAQGTSADGRPWRFKLACTDGPVFDAPQVVW
jgi:dihydroorotate dehydrogenase electron transfer subunit